MHFIIIAIPLAITLLYGLYRMLLKSIPEKEEAISLFVAEQHSLALQREERLQAPNDENN